MIILKSNREIELMRKAGKIAAGALKLAGEAVKPGIDTAEIDRIIHSYIVSQKAKPSFLGYQGYPASSCISVNREVIHGIPGKRKILEGDIVSIDIGVFIDGFHGDCAATFGAGIISDKAKKLMDVTRQSLKLGIEKAVPGNRIGDIGFAISEFVEKNGFSVVMTYVGHGVGASLHEDPSVPNKGLPGSGIRLEKGMTLAIEPMINEGAHFVKTQDDGWTVVTNDGKLSAHFEHTIAITDGEPEILTIV